MPEHFTKATCEASFWCKKCGKDTPHHVYDGRHGACMVCIKRLEDAPKVVPPARQDSLF